ncbi:hypothetical protein HK098_002810 [Nowakowskiella sp. JEL0407]|nr:hypothetical protein HK098_002810 [Nowakowskiella sp. JEL0407]
MNSHSNSLTKYIADENKYSDKMLRKNMPLQKEFKNQLQNWNDALKFTLTGEDLDSGCGRLPDDVDSYWNHGTYFYYKNYSNSFPRYFRRPTSNFSTCLIPSSSDKLVIDLSQLVKSQTGNSTGYFAVGIFEVNPFDENLVAVSLDLSGDENFKLFIWDIKAFEIIAQPSNCTYFSVRWSYEFAIDSSIEGKRSWVYYNVVHPKYGVPSLIHRYCASLCKASEDEFVYEEKDISKTTELVETNDNQYLFIKVFGQTSTSYLLIRNNSVIPQEPERIYPNQPNETITEYEHNGNYFYIRSNINAPNFKIDRYSTTSSVPTFQPIVETQPDVYIERLESFADHLVVWILQNGRRIIRIYMLTNSNSDEIVELVYTIDPSSFGEWKDVYAIYPNCNDDLETRVYTIFYSVYYIFTISSMASPPKTYKFTFKNKTIELISEITMDEVQRTNYETEYVRIGENKVPATIVQRVDGKSERKKLLVLAYGAYGGTIDPKFTVDYFPLLTRNYIIAICHPRGDIDFGYEYYTAGKYENKVNTFLDVKECITGLSKLKNISSERIGFMGRSAGGLVAGDIVNSSGKSEFGDLVRVVVAMVPFVDPIFDLKDEFVPWTPFEWFEWGNPVTNLTIFKAMRDYSPYQNIKEISGKLSIYVTAGLKDSRVPYWEPVKYVAKLRDAVKKCRQKSWWKRCLSAKIILRVTDSGHFGGTSSKFDETAEWFAFLDSELNS